MENIKLVYFRGCPNYKSVKKLLTRIGVSFDEINQDDLSDGHPLKRFTSLTILKNEKLIFGKKLAMRAEVVLSVFQKDGNWEGN